jgi:pre-mRNA-splicing factor SYF1
MLAARQVFEKAILSDFTDYDDLAAVWIEWILMELRFTIDTYRDPLGEQSDLVEIARRAVSQYRGSTKSSAQSQLFKSVKLWHLVIDVEHSFNGSSKPDLVRGLFDAMIDLNVITPQTILNYAAFEAENLRYERACQILERGITSFPWPHRRDIWLMYFDLANQRRFPVERIRHLLDQSLQGAIPAVVPHLSYFSFKYELEKGFASDCSAVLHRSTQQCDLHEKLSFYYLGIQHAMRTHGTPQARRILQDAVDELTEVGRKNGASDTLVVELCIQYARLETEAGQIERARKVFEHAAQFANPNKTEMNDFWVKWKDFEIEHGSEVTYKDMKRLRRSVEVLYSEKHFNTLDAGLDNQTEITETPVSIEATALPAPGIDLTKLRLMAQQRKGQSAGVSDFILSPTFEESKPGYVFKHGELGTGYYKDE